MPYVPGQYLQFNDTYGTGELDYDHDYSEYSDVVQNSGYSHYWEQSQGAGHSGYFSDDNPYFHQLLISTNKKDQDALYAQAVEWQAGRANVLEQREYESPLARLQRERSAGINSDIAGANMGGSSSASPALTMAQPSTPYASTAQDQDLLMRGFETASNFMSGFANFGSAVCNAVDMFMTQPYRKRMMSAQSDLANSQANLNNIQAQHLSDMSPYLVEGQYLTNQGQQLLNDAQGHINYDLYNKRLDSYINFIGNLATTFPDADDDYLRQQVQGLYGIDGADMVVDDVHKFKDNPAWQAKYQASIAQARNGAAYNSVYTEDIYKNLHTLRAKNDIASENLKLVSTQLQTDLESYLSEHGYAEAQGSNMMFETEIDEQKMILAQQRVAHDINAFVQTMEFSRTEYLDTQKRIDELRAKDEDLTREEQAELDSLVYYQAELMTIGSERFQEVVKLANNMAMKRYLNSYNIAGGDMSLSDLKYPLLFTEYTFGNYIKGNFDADHLKIALAGSMMSNLKQGTEIGQNIAETFNIPFDNFVKLIGAIF